MNAPNLREEDIPIKKINFKFMLIESLDQIPNGKRACYMYVFQCQGCGYKEVSIVDFLQVRDNMIVKGGGTYPHETFREFLSQV